MKLSHILTVSFAASALLMACGSSTPSEGTGGSSGAGGSGGSSGKDAGSDAGSVAACISVADDLIADFTKDNGLNPADGRQGGFYVYGDSKGTFDPPKVGDDPYPIDSSNGNSACSGPGSFHLKATGFAEWGAAMGADFMPKQGDSKGYYDASKYKGVSFWAKASALLSGVQVSFPDIYTDGGADPTTVDSSGSKCGYVPGSTINCSPYLVKFGSGNYAASKIDTEWKRFDVLFADTKQDEYNIGAKAPGDVLAVKYLTAMAIQVNAIYVNGSPTANDFELWVDDVNFIK